MVNISMIPCAVGCVLDCSRYDDCGNDGVPDPNAIRLAQKLGGNGAFIDFDASLSQHPPLWAHLKQQEAAAAAVDPTGEGRRLSGTAWSGVSYPCGNDAAMSAFLKDPAVMQALHVNKTKSGQSYHSTASDLRPLYKQLAAK